MYGERAVGWLERVGKEGAYHVVIACSREGRRQAWRRG